MKNNYFEIDKIEQVQKLLCSLLYDFHKICEENSLSYSLAYGTLLGAVRHGGFIPWDDDVDVFMPRPDYEKFAVIVKNKYADKFDLFDDNDNYIYTYLKFCMKNTILYENTVVDTYSKLALYIDIFPLDAVPKNKNKSYKYIEKLDFIVSLLTVKFDIKKRNILKRIFIKIIKIIQQIFGYKIIKKIIKLEKNEFVKTKFDNSSIITCRIGNKKNVLASEMPKTYIEDRCLLKFEKNMFWVTSNYDDVLKKYYGNYNKLPPLENRKPKHNYRLFIKEN